MRSQLRTRIESVMTGPAGGSTISLSGFLSVLGAVYGGITKLRSDVYGRGWLPVNRLPCRVISVGNLALGGTGKTPMTIYLSQQIQSMGFRTAVISRGYGGRAERTGGIVSDGSRLFMESIDAGDEPYMMAKNLKGIPVLVGQNRYHTGSMALDAFAPEVIILDDAYQHLRLHRDINLVLLDASNPFGNGHLFPRGTLREPISALSRADAIIMTRCTGGIPPQPSTASRPPDRRARRLPVFHTVHDPSFIPADSHWASQGSAITRHVAGEGSSMNVFAFSAIARNEELVHSLDVAGYTVVGTRFFPDHHPYSEGDIHGIIRAARGANATVLVTTEKDFARLGTGIQWPIPLIVAGVSISFGCQTETFHRFILKKLGGSPSGEVT